MKLPAHRDTTLSLPEYKALLKTEEGRRIIIENANDLAEQRLEQKAHNKRGRRDG